MASERPMTERIIRALRDGPARGQTELMARVLGPEYSLDEWTDFQTAMRWHLVFPQGVIEEKLQLAGTGHEGPPVYEYVYRLPTDAEKAKYL